jgi:hypothetical protein
MIELYYWPTPNGHKITMFLEEAELPYRIYPVDISAGDQFTMIAGIRLFGEMRRNSGSRASSADRGSAPGSTGVPAHCRSRLARGRCAMRGSPS